MDPTLAASIVAVVVATLGAYSGLRGKKAEVKVSEGSNLTVGQQGFIDRLQKANDRQAEQLMAMETRLAALQAKIDAQDAQIRALKDQLRQTIADLEDEREARRAGEDAGAHRQKVAEERMRHQFNGGANLDDDDGPPGGTR